MEGILLIAVGVSLVWAFRKFRFRQPTFRKVTLSDLDTPLEK